MAIVDYAERVGISKEGASFLLSILGVTSTVRQTIYIVVFDVNVTLMYLFTR